MTLPAQSSACTDEDSQQIREYLAAKQDLQVCDSNEGDVGTVDVRPV